MSKPKMPKINIEKFKQVVRRKTHNQELKEQAIARSRMLKKVVLVQQPFFWKLDKARRQELMRLFSRLSANSAEMAFNKDAHKLVEERRSEKISQEQYLTRLSALPVALDMYMTQEDIAEFAKKNMIPKKDMDTAVKKMAELIVEISERRK